MNAVRLPAVDDDVFADNPSSVRTGPLQIGVFDVTSTRRIVAYLLVHDVDTTVQDEGVSDLPDLFQVLADDYARRILVAADPEPMTAKALSDACDASLATVYRRAAMLKEYGLVEERESIGPDGAHRSEFETTLEEIHVDLSDGELELSLQTRDELADNFTSMWDGIRGDR